MANAACRGAADLLMPIEAAILASENNYT